MERARIVGGIDGAAEVCVAVWGAAFEKDEEDDKLIDGRVCWPLAICTLDDEEDVDADPDLALEFFVDFSISWMGLRLKRGCDGL